MERTKLIRTLKNLLAEQFELKKGTSIHFQTMDEILKALRVQNINENFTGTLQEIHAYVSEGQFHPNPYAHIQLHKMNIERWVKELELLSVGGGAVTIDYEQRKGREI
ncbi:MULTISPECIES: YtzH-like family protein [Bacillaceae]|uniref:YtzH-like family protein n=1 Tax=Evansella alkalicola TaxID=745819 RepID=A0ABS6JR84_9BACI|nr:MULTISPECIES: YtzH-like family protein [Bacillaceae]MBU9721073.1 YtzH-like family protein [Bacillus alkalicola]